MLNLVPSAFMASFPWHRVRLAWPFAVIVALMLVLCNASLDVMSGMRALSNAEGARSKALAYAVRDLEQYAQMRDDDAFWAARRVAAFTDELIRAAVHTGEYSDPAAEKYLGDVLIKRRDKIASTYLTAVNPIVAPRLDANGRLTFENAAIAAGVANGPATYRASWLRFDNATGETQALSETQSSTTTIEVPSGVPTASGSFIAVDISADSEGHPSWRRPIRTYFRRAADGWTLVGLERLPETLSADPAVKSSTR